MIRRVALVRTEVSEELRTSIIRLTKIGELGATLAVTSNRRARNVHALSASDESAGGWEYLGIISRHEQTSHSAGIPCRSWQLIDNITQLNTTLKLDVLRDAETIITVTESTALECLVSDEAIEGLKCHTQWDCRRYAYWLRVA
jgi:hypothetical protein